MSTSNSFTQLPPTGKLTEASEAFSASIQLETEHVDRQLIYTTSVDGQIELADRHAKRQIELDKRQNEHADGEIEQNDEHTPAYVEWQVEWQIEQAEKQNEQTDGQSESIDWPNNLIEIIKEVVMNDERTLQISTFSSACGQETLFFATSENRWSNSRATSQRRC